MLVITTGAPYGLAAAPVIKVTTPTVIGRQIYAAGGNEGGEALRHQD
jgi:ABC-type xylose transport system permease subunit